MMIINFKNNNCEYVINAKENIIFFGQDSIYKNNFINNLKDSLLNKKNNILIDGNIYNPKDYNIIYIDEESDFNNEFKFTKTNTLKKLIYDEIINKINGDKLIKYTNEVFDVIDKKVNSMLDKKINKTSDNSINFEIEIPNINTIIDKFTNIYIDNILINSNDITKSTKRKLLYQLYFLDIKKNSDKQNIVLIKNFDAYLNSNETIELLNTINKLSNNNCHFILSSSSNIFEYVPLNNFYIYKITNKLISFKKIDKAIKTYLLKKEYNNEINFDEFYIKNEHLILKEEIDLIKKQLFNLNSVYISKILNTSKILITLNKPKKITCDYIVCRNKEERNLFLEISKEFID